jgi:undecaprenyl-diphosphatase
MAAKHRVRWTELVKTTALAVSLAALTADVRAGGAIASAEARRCRPLGPAPGWARFASRLPERTPLVATCLVVAGHRLSLGRPVVAPLLRLGGGVLARAAFASAVRRPRPPDSWWRAQPHGWSYPSRHTTHALLATAVLAEELTFLPRSGRTAVVAGTTCAVGLSRVRLGVHWPSDVAGGALTGALWLRLTSALTRKQ